LILSDLQTASNSVIYFVVKNNPAAVLSVLSSMGEITGAPQDYTEEDLYFIVQGLSNSEISEALSVPYLNEAQNGTGGYESELTQGIYTIDRSPAIILAIITGVFSVGSGFFQLQNSNNQTEIAEISYEALLAQQQAEKDRQILGLDPLSFVVVAVSVAAIIITAIIVISKKNRK
jgi:hypothetical protein